MKLNTKIFYKYLFLFYFGGATYVLAEVLYRDYSHWSMFILGGLCFICLGLENKILSWSIPLWIQMLIGGCIITILELIAGLIVNVWLGWNIWCYNNPTNFMHQISLWSSLGWCGLSLIGIVLDDVLRWQFFGEEKPHYKLF